MAVPDRSTRIERQHSQEMAIRYLALQNRLDGETGINLDLVKQTIEWFVADLGPTEEEDATENWGHFCVTCGNKQEFKQSKNDKGKEWQGYFCTKDPTHTPLWRKWEGK